MATLGWAAAAQSLVGSVGSEDARGTVGPGLHLGDSPSVSQCYEHRRRGSGFDGRAGKVVGDGFGDSSQRLLCLKSTRGGSTFCCPNLSW